MLGPKPKQSLALLCLAAAVLLGLNGCVFMSDEDRDFYGKGWVNPRELDQPAPHHVVPNPEAPQDPSQVAAGTGAHPNPDGDEWTAPPLQ